MSINMPQLIFQRAESAPPLPSQMSQAALSGGQSLREGGLLLGGGGELLLGEPCNREALGTDNAV